MSILNSYGKYEITCLVKKYYNDTEKEKIITVEAQNEKDAIKKAEKQLKFSYNSFKIASCKFIKSTQPTSSLMHNTIKQTPTQRKRAILIGIIAIIFLVIIFVLVGIGIIN